VHRFFLAVLTLCLAAPAARAQAHTSVTEWLTTPDRTALLARQPGTLAFHSATGQSQASLIAVDDAQRFQTVDGFGMALTGGSAQLMMAMDAGHRRASIAELFGNGSDAIGISYIRVSIGSSDMNQSVYTYDDMPAGGADPQLSRFSLQGDETTVIPVLREILAVHPGLKILASPWSAPSWMKTNDAPKGGTLKPEDYAIYAQYLVRYLKAMQAYGIPIAAITMQNEPLNPKNTPSMVMQSDEQDRFLKNDFGPLLRKSGLSTQVILFDHNCNHPDYPISILADPAAAQYAAGSGFHLYEGTIGALSAVHDAFPNKSLYFTEQMIVDKPGATELAIAGPVQRVVIGAMRNWSRNVLLWNLAADPALGPHTGDGGCPVCQGAITIDGNAVQRNLAFYTIAHAAKFVPPGSVRIASDPSMSPSTNPGAQDGLADVAFRTADGGYALIVSNASAAEQRFAIVFHGEQVETSLPAGAVATYVW
jgi:glucosylceramidase